LGTQYSASWGSTAGRGGVREGGSGWSERGEGRLRWVKGGVGAEPAFGREGEACGGGPKARCAREGVGSTSQVKG